MPLPTNQNWPPESWRKIYAVYAEHAAWYGGDLDVLANLYAYQAMGPYAGGSSSQHSFESVSGASRTANGVREEVRDLIHVPAAADLAATSSAMLFGEHPKIKIAEAHEENAPADAIAAQDTLDAILRETSVYSRLSEAADTAAGLGGIFLKINWDSSVSPYPIISTAQVDNAIPEFKFGILTAVTFWKEVESDGSRVLRLIERHEPGVILSGLYLGSTDKLGNEIGLENHAETAGLDPEIKTGLPGLACVYVPNMLPNRKNRGLRIGQSDYASSESLMLSLDEVFTSLLRDIKLGLGRIIAPAEYFETDGAGSWRFDIWRQSYLKLDAMQGADSTTGDNITLSQFEIRTQQHIDAAWTYLRQIYITAGYSPQTFGMDIEGSAESGTALTIRERKSFNTIAKKADYWRPALEYMLYVAQVIYKEQMGGRITPYPVTVEMQDGVQTDIGQVAQSVELLNRAQALSIETKVRMVHPDWTIEQVTAEVKRIQDETGMSVPDPMQVGVA